VFWYVATVERSSRSYTLSPPSDDEIKSSTGTWKRAERYVQERREKIEGEMGRREEDRKRRTFA
jgi:hypothetical protein